MQPRVYQLTRWKEFRLWVEDERAQLGMDVATYYGICCFCGLVQGLSIGNCMILVLR